MSAPPRAILFDKDGTLTDFRATWEAWIGGALDDLAAEAGASSDALATAAGYDRAAGRLAADAPVVTETGTRMAARLSAVTGWPPARVLEWWNGAAKAVMPVPAVPLAPLLDGLLDRGLCLGVLTNDTGAGVRHDLEILGVLDRFAHVVAADDGHGAKPDPGGALAFARAVDLAPDRVILVGDGLFDMSAARGAGMCAVGVTTGTLDRSALAPHADAVLDDVGALPGWLDGH